MGAYDVLTFDSYFCDLIVTGLPELPRLGLDLFGTDMGIEAGGTFNSVRALHRLGAKVGWVTDFGTDLFSQFVIGEAEKEGVDTALFRRHDRPVRIFSVAFSFAHDRGFISFKDKVARFDRARYVRKYRPRAVLIASIETEARGRALAQAAREVGATVFLDSQATSKTLQTRGAREILAMSDVLLLNVAEALGICGATDRDAAGRALADIAPLVVLKSGADGAYAYRRGKRPVHAPGLRVKVVDTTGAGDCFNAGFIAAHLRGKPLARCLAEANVCGALSTTAHGTVATPTLAEVNRRLA